ncbi:FtsX-like permease family protein [Sulfidibacter corallicola]|uniref:FtsX-like permease family protein n=1 Tax=Sulfidibacter corallicola TaxID=2818388 RepID=A0A8A4TDR7_SULCO|nr:FtsX-like permease family protein [Sulfidibacter corallicola]QTD47793.1 FtsX-like permease family protein [Sulfidibacter corallicola]
MTTPGDEMQTPSTALRSAGWHASLRWAARTAWRDGRGSFGKASLYALSMALGIATLVALGSFGADLSQALQGQTKTLLGADLVVYSRQPFSEKAEKVVAPIPATTAEIRRFATMAYFPAHDQALLCRIRAVGGGFPFYGELVTEPAEAAQTYRDGPNLLVDGSLLERVGAKVGEKLRLGEFEFTIAGKLVSTPGVPPAASLLGPRVYMPLEYVEQTNLIQRGSRVFYSKAFRLDEAYDVDAWIKQNKEDLREERLSWSTVAQRRQQIGDDMNNLSAFLSLTALLTLLLGGLGVAGAVHYHVQQKLRQIAVLRCLGATTAQVVTVYLLQVMAMTLTAVLLGTLMGVGLQYYLPTLVRDLFPVAYEPAFQPEAVGLAVGWGFLLSFLLALAPLAAIRRVSPLVSFRLFLAPAGRDWVQIACYGLVLLTWLGFAMVRTQSVKTGFLFLGGLLAAVAVLYATAKLLGWGARRLAAAGLPFTWRHGLSSLFRPHNQTAVLMVILGMGIFLVAVLAGARAMLLGQFTTAIGQDKPNFIAFDIQADQLDGVLEVVRDNQMSPQNVTPILAMRLERIKGVSIKELLATDIPEWALRREYRSTYRGSLSETEELVAGEWISEVDPDVSPVPVSFEIEQAEMLGLSLGDTLVVDVMGIPIEAQVTSLRKVAWQSMQPNFYMLFPEGYFENAPQMFLFTTRTENPEQVAALQRDLVKKYPNVSCADLTQLVLSFDKILDKAASMVRFLAGLCMLTGLVLLASALWNSRYQRMGEQALLRTLGAGRRQVALMTLAEYFLLGVLATLTGLTLALVASWALGTFLFQVTPFPDLAAVVLPALLLPPLTVVMGYLSHRGLWDVPAIQVLREEGR